MCYVVHPFSFDVIQSEAKDLNTYPVAVFRFFLPSVV